MQMIWSFKMLKRIFICWIKKYMVRRWRRTCWQQKSYVHNLRNFFVIVIMICRKCSNSDSDLLVVLRLFPSQHTEDLLWPLCSRKLNLLETGLSENWAIHPSPSHVPESCSQHGHRFDVNSPSKHSLLTWCHEIPSTVGLMREYGWNRPQIQWIIMIHHDSSSCLHEITISGSWTPRIFTSPYLCGTSALVLRVDSWPGGIHVGLHLFRRSGDQQDPCEAAQPRGPPSGPALYFDPVPGIIEKFHVWKWMETYRL